VLEYALFSFYYFERSSKGLVINLSFPLPPSSPQKKREEGEGGGVCITHACVLIVLSGFSGVSVNSEAVGEGS
jgi:hypothetical protein